jgi:TonB family protein
MAIWILVAALRIGTPTPAPLAPVQVEAPEYPENAVKAHMEGVVEVAVSVAADGSVTLADAGGKPNPLLASVSEAAARLWRFEPDAGQVERRTVLRFDFSLKVEKSEKQPQCFVGPSRVTVILPSTVRILGWSRIGPPTVNYGTR